MFSLLSTIFTLLCLLLSLVALLLSLWIVLPAPTETLLPLSVGAPEISPWLLLLSVAVGFLTLLVWSLSPSNRWCYLSLALCCLSLSLNAVPFVQLRSTVQRANTTVRSVLGSDYLASIPLQVKQHFRPAPYIFRDSFTGILRQDNSPAIRITKDIEFATPADASLRLDSYRPRSTGLYPTLVVIYGGAWQRGSPASNVEFNYYMAQQGYTVLAIDYRHAPQYRFPAQTEDITAALAYIKDHTVDLGVDLDRVILLGRSAGAHLAMLTAYQAQPLQIQAVVSYYGPVNLINGYNNPPRPDPIRTRDVLETFLGGTPQTKASLYRQASPIEYVVNPVVSSLPPTLLVYGGRDKVVEAKYGRALGERLHENDNSVVFIEIPWADHAFDTIFRGVSNQVALYYTERFIAHTLYSNSMTASGSIP